MGTHPIFESDFDCLTELIARRSSTNLAMEQFVPLTFNEKNIADLRENYNLSIGQFQATNAVNKEAFYQTKFQLAHALILSENLRDINEGIDFLKQLIREHENMTANRDYAYFIAIGLLDRKNMKIVCENASRFCALSLKIIK